MDTNNNSHKTPSEGRVRYPLYDNNGDTYIIWVKPETVTLLDLDSGLSNRTLNRVKASGQQPFERWLPNASSSILIEESTVDQSWSPGQDDDTDISQDDLRSPCAKKSRRRKPEASKSLNSSFTQIVIDDDENNNEELAVPLDDIKEEEVSGEPVTEATVTPSSKTYVTTWTDAAVHALMNAMGAFIEEFSKKRTPRTVYEKISAKLLHDGFMFTPDAVYDKKRGCDTTYGRVLKKHMSGTKVTWPFFEAMQYLRAGHWPNGFVSGANSSRNSSDCNNTPIVDIELGGERSNETSQNISNEFDWNFLNNGGNENAQVADNEFVCNVNNGGNENAQVADNQVPVIEAQGLPAEPDDKYDEALVEEVAEAQQGYADNPLLKNVALFEKVAKGMRARGYPYETGLSVRVRYEALAKKFKDEFDNLDATGYGKSIWPLYRKMFDLEKKSVNVVAPVTVSAGAAALIKRAEKSVNTLRAGKERPQTSSAQNRVEKLIGKKSSALGYRNEALELQKQRLELERQYLEEFRSYRLDSREKTQAIREGFQTLNELKALRKQDDGKD